MLSVHTLEVCPTVDALNESVGEALLARLRMLIDEAEAPARINLALSGGAVRARWRQGAKRRPGMGGLLSRGHRRGVRAHADLR